MSLRRTYKTDQNAEQEGVWIEAGFNDHNNQPIRVKLSRASKANARYSKIFEEITKPHMEAIQSGTLDKALADKLDMEVFVKGLMRDWENLPTSELTGVATDEALLEFTEENAMALFAELPELYQNWAAKSNAITLFREKQQETNAKNSPKS